MEDLEKEVSTDAVLDPPSEEGKETETQEEQELSDDEVKSEVERLKEEAKTTEDPKEKRHLEQQAGRLQQLAKAREKASLAEKSAKEKEDALASLEAREIDYVYDKAIDEKYGLSYFEEIYKTNPSLADKVAQAKWGTTAKKIINESKKQLADSGDDQAKESLTMEELEAKAEHKVAVREAKKVFSDLDESELETAQKYFDRISGKGLLTIDEALEFADMAKHYATRGRKPTAIEKEKVIADKASTTISTKAPPKTTPDFDKEAFIQTLVNSGINRQLAEMYANGSPTL